MRKILKTHIILSILLLTTCCVSKYKGPPPNFDLKGESAKAEIERFKFSEGYWSQHYNAFTMGPESETYFTSSSLEPIISEVSPKSLQIIEKSKKWEYIQWLTFGAALAMLTIELTDNDGKFFTQDQSIFYYSLIGTSLGSSYVRLYFMSKAAEQYNQDLRSRFVPTISFNFPLN